jgi:hypothetical protein
MPVDQPFITTNVWLMKCPAILSLSVLAVAVSALAASFTFLLTGGFLLCQIGISSNLRSSAASLSRLISNKTGLGADLGELALSFLASASQAVFTAMFFFQFFHLSAEDWCARLSTVH